MKLGIIDDAGVCLPLVRGQEMLIGCTRHTCIGDELVCSALRSDDQLPATCQNQLDLRSLPKSFLFLLEAPGMLVCTRHSLTTYNYVNNVLTLLPRTYLVKRSF